MRTKQYRYTEWVQWDPRILKANWTNVKAVELYDHQIDPDENLNLSDRPGLEKIQAQLKIQLREKFKLK